MEKLICFDKLIVEKPKISKDSFLTVNLDTNMKKMFLVVIYKYTQI